MLLRKPTITTKLWQKITCRAARRILAAMTMERRFRIMTTPMRKAITMQKVATIPTITRTSRHHTPSKIILVTVMCNPCNNLNMMSTLVTALRMLGKARLLRLRLHNKILIRTLDSSSKHLLKLSRITDSSSNLGMMSTITTNKKEVSRKSIEKIKSILLSMILRNWDHVEFAAENSILTAFRSMKLTVSKCSRKSVNNLTHKNIE